MARLSSAIVPFRSTCRNVWRRAWPVTVTRATDEFQLKVGSDVATDIARVAKVADGMGRNEVLVADANGGWLSHEALQVVHALRDLDVYIEQPCLTYEENLTIRRQARQPFILDEFDRRDRRVAAGPC